MIIAAMIIIVNSYGIYYISGTLYMLVHLIRYLTVKNKTEYWAIMSNYSSRKRFISSSMIFKGLPALALNANPFQYLFTQSINFLSRITNYYKLSGLKMLIYCLKKPPNSTKDQ